MFYPQDSKFHVRLCSDRTRTVKILNQESIIQGIEEDLKVFKAVRHIIFYRNISK
jgi:hypothetical protein